jgi:hypothetical protein
MLESKEETRLYESETVALPSIRVVLGEVPNPDPVKRRSTPKTRHPRGRELADIVRRIIAHIEGM